MANEQTKYSDGFYDRALTKEEQASRDRPWGFEVAMRIGLDKFIKTKNGQYILKRPANVDCIYDY